MHQTFDRNIETQNRNIEIQKKMILVELYPGPCLDLPFLDEHFPFISKKVLAGKWNVP